MTLHLDLGMMMATPHCRYLQLLRLWTFLSFYLLYLQSSKYKIYFYDFTSNAKRCKIYFYLLRVFLTIKSTTVKQIRRQYMKQTSVLLGRLYVQLNFLCFYEHQNNTAFICICVFFKSAQIIRNQLMLYQCLGEFYTY